MGPIKGKSKSYTAWPGPAQRVSGHVSDSVPDVPGVPDPVPATTDIVPGVPDGVLIRI